MAWHDVTHHKDGGVSTSIRYREKRIRDTTTGQWRTMCSFDGVTWRLKAHRDEEQLRLLRACNLKGAAWEKQKKKEFDARVNPGVKKAPDPVILRVTHHGSPSGKKRGKLLKSHTNAKSPKNYLNVAEQNGVKLIGPPVQGGLPSLNKKRR